VTLRNKGHGQKDDYRGKRTDRGQQRNYVQICFRKLFDLPSVAAALNDGHGLWKLRLRPALAAAGPRRINSACI
jgi:hypothetical protein